MTDDRPIMRDYFMAKIKGQETTVLAKMLGVLCLNELITSEQLSYILGTEDRISWSRFEGVSIILSIPPWDEIMRAGDGLD